MRYYDWPEQMRHSPLFTIPKDFVVRHGEDGPEPSMWSLLTKPEKSIIVSILSCTSIGKNSPSEALLAALCGIKTRKTVRNALYKLEKRDLIKVNRGNNRNIIQKIEQKDDNINISASLIIDGHWQVIGEKCPSSHALYVALLALMPDERSVQPSASIICKVAGISMRHYKVTLAQLIKRELASLWEWPRQRVIPSVPAGRGYTKSFLESLWIE
ncbi:MAG: hypothetical protein EOM37_11270 [Proteobacteria bacterium]|nr:hypothetical protein [Pseudomonadota bacterium]